jgi:hypothetical protein
MSPNKKTDYKRKYAMAKHHAWAGSVLLAILGAMRWFVMDSTYLHKDLIFIIAGLLIITYILIALFFTYRFRSGLAEEVQVQQQIITNKSSDSVESTTILSPKEQEKIEKKKAKAESKKRKKIAKTKEKEEKNS